MRTGWVVSWGRSTKKPPLSVENGGLWVKRWGATSCSLWAYDRALGAKRMAAL